MLNYNHPFHLVSSRPWPLFISFSLFNLIIRIIIFFHEMKYRPLFLRIVLRGLVIYQWWRDVVREGLFQGFHTKVVYKGLRIGIFLFIISEVFFFIGFFWAYFHMSLSPRIEIGSVWPPKGIKLFNPYDIPLLNTVILISSGFVVTWSHYSLICNKIQERKLRLLLTIILGIFFSIIQLIEYKECYFCISDGIFGSLFFILTGFHGIHVLVGTIFLLVNYIRFIIRFVNPYQHLRIESAIWYWHFVDVVWLFLYLLVYCWIY